jgi:hypothetical protein
MANDYQTCEKGINKLHPGHEYNKRTRLGKCGVCQRANLTFVKGKDGTMVPGYHLAPLPR